MVSVNLNFTQEELGSIESCAWINWSAVAREAARKKRIFEDYLATKEVTEEDWQFCEAIDWHPVDELELREEFIKELNSVRNKRNYRTFKDAEELKKHLFPDD